MNWKKFHAMKDSDIDFSDCPEITPDMFRNAILRVGMKPVRWKIDLTLRIDNDVAEWLRSRERTYDLEVNYLLRGYMNASKIAAYK